MGLRVDRNSYVLRALALGLRALNRTFGIGVIAVNLGKHESEGSDGDLLLLFLATHLVLEVF